jgi:hypothetical protein
MIIENPYGYNKLYIEYWITKISNNGAVYESVYNACEFPTKDDLNTDHFNYRIRYRQ